MCPLIRMYLQTKNKIENRSQAADMNFVQI